MYKLQFGAATQHLHFKKLYLHSPTISLDEPILDRRGSYTHERHSLMRYYK